MPIFVISTFESDYVLVRSVRPRPRRRRARGRRVTSSLLDAVRAGGVRAARRRAVERGSSAGHDRRHRRGYRRGLRREGAMAGHRPLRRVRTADEGALRRSRGHDLGARRAPPPAATRRRRSTSPQRSSERSSWSAPSPTRSTTSITAPASLFDGTTGPALVGFRLTSDAALADELHGLVLGNVDNPTDDISWGAPGTILVALAMRESDRASSAGRTQRRSRQQRCARAAATTTRGARTTTTAASERSTARPVTRSRCSVSGLTTSLRARRRRSSLAMPCAKTASRTGPAPSAGRSREAGTAASACNGAPARRAFSPARGTTSTKSSSWPAPS